MGVQFKSELQHTGTHQPQHDRHTACVIAHQDSSATFISLRLRCRKDKFCAPPNNAAISTFFFSLF
jgi:hypothetical protein